MITLTHDITLDIATGKDRHTKTWRNAPMQWSALLDRLSGTHRTTETHKEYLAAKPQRQAEIKDIGGFVGGYLNGGRRKTGHVLHRQLVTLDADYASPDMWGGFTLLYDNAAAVYSTHKHSPESPRLRILIPLDREVLPDEYVPIARRLADYFSINHFDPTGFRPTQLMYWPSTSKDGEYLFEYQDGPLFSADELLATYKDWKDSSAWPMSEREREIPVQAIRKQGDPLEKPGIIGAFCRTYSIQDALHTFLAEQYSPTEDDNRWTYVHGSTAGGLVLYEDKYAYSHHGTDPVSGKLCNAFDLVRVHLFGLKDEDCDPGTTVTKLPSYAAMSELAASDPEVRKLRGREMLESAQYDFADDLLDQVFGEEGKGEEPDDSWKEKLEMDAKAENYMPTVENILTILQNDPRLKGRFGFDLFEYRETALKSLPWRVVTPSSRYLTDKDDSGIRHYIETFYGISSAAKVVDAMAMLMMKNTYHPVRDYLKGLKWDGEARVETLFIDYMGAEDNLYTRAVARKWLCAAVARVMVPGCKFDYMPLLIGEQGEMKSTLPARLGSRWYSDSVYTVQGKDAYEQLKGVWIAEMAELSAMKHSEVEAAKHFISKSSDRYREAYGRRPEDFLRQCVFIGTSNRRRPLKDPTGGRRFWPIDTRVTEPVKHVIRDLTEYEVGQIWAEAMEYYRQGEELYLTGEVEKMAIRQQAEKTEQDERAGLVAEFLETLLPEDWEDWDLYKRRDWLQNGDGMAQSGTVERTKVCVAEVWCELFGKPKPDMTNHNTKPIHDLIRSIPGWMESPGNKLKFKIYGVQKAYIRRGNPVASASEPIATNDENPFD